jgi:hypothetical protein
MSASRDARRERIAEVRAGQWNNKILYLPDRVAYAATVVYKKRNENILVTEQDGSKFSVHIDQVEMVR